MRFIALLLLLAPLGCGRAYYRRSADAETYPIVRERVIDPAFDIGRTRLEPAAFSRLADPTNPDRPPKPPDDPAAGVFMARPGGLKGAKGWEKDGVSDRIEPAGWEDSLGAEPSGAVKLTSDKAVEIALVNSREYQTALEAVYLQALGLTLNRFEFDCRYFARTGPQYTRVGASSLPFESNTLLVPSGVGFARNLAAGGQLLADFANSFVWEFTGRTSSVSGAFNVTLIQPLLRGFGRKVRLEGLTQAERDVLYAVRDFARFRKQFWAGVAVDDGGYLQQLVLIQALRNARANAKAQEENYALYRRLFQGGRTAVTNVDQVYQGLLNARRGVVQSEIASQNSLDAYKLRLGLPPRLAVEVDDKPLDRFVLVEPDTEKLRAEIDQFERARAAELGDVPSAEALRQALDTLAGYADRAGTVIDNLDRDLKAWERDLKRQVGPDEEEQQERSRAAYEQLRDRPGELRGTLSAHKTTIATVRGGLTEANREAAWGAAVAAASGIGGVIDSASTAGAQAKLDTVRLPEVDLSEEEALAFAKAHRLDLMNAQARVTDNWRRVTVAANALRSDLTVRLDASLLTDADARNPFEINNDVSRYAVGVQFDGPLNRQAERNVYRASLVAYQQSRRAYMAASDRVELDIRTGLRALRQQRVNFEIARQQVLVATRQLAIERRNLTAPAQPQGRGDDAAVLRILQAQQQLLDARNALAVGFFGFEQQRVRLLINLEALLLDARGFPANDAPAPAPAAEPAAGSPPP